MMAGLSPDSVRGLNREIFRLAVPSIIANITIPIVGMVAIAVVGHLEGDSSFSTAALIGGISIGSMIFDLMYWNFGFLRTGTGGFTAQAYGRGDTVECADIFVRAEGIALLCAAFLLAVQWLVVKVALMVVDASPEVEYLAQSYFYVRVWAAPATLSLMAIKGWLIGMQDGFSPMLTDIVVNVVNIVLSIVLTLGVHWGVAGGFWAVDYAGIGFIGVAKATVIAQYSGFAVGLALVFGKYRRVFASYTGAALRSAFRGPEVRAFFRTNADLFVRSLCFIGIYIGFTTIAAGFGDLILATSSIMMQLMMLFSYITDGFAYAGEALTGRFVGGRNLVQLRRTVLWTFIWSFAVTSAFIVAYGSCGQAMLRLLTSDADVLSCGADFLVWLLLMPVAGCAAFTWDGIFTGATGTAHMRNSMLLAVAAYFALFYACDALFNKAGDGITGLHILLGAYCIHLVLRTVYLSLAYRSGVLAKV